MKTIFVILFCVLTIISVDCYKILAVLPLSSSSHYFIGNSIVKDYLDAGHEVTVIQPYPSKGNTPNRTDIVIEEIKDAFGGQNVNPFELGQASWMIGQLFIYQLGKATVETIMTNQKVVDLLNSNEKFDLVLYEIFGMDSFAGLGQHFGCPVIGYTTFGVLKWTNDITGNPNGHSYIPNPFLSYTAKMTLSQRFYNKISSIIEAVLVDFRYLPIQRDLYKRFFPKSKFTFDESLKNVSLILVNDHFSQSSVKPYLPNMIEISGNHVQKTKPLPEDLQKYLDSAEEGVVYFSMGSMIQGKNWDPVKRETLVKAFSQLKTKVLWKYENDTLPNQPKNVRIGHWLPQRDILSHPNVKIFITHGGLLGTTESIVTGKPVIGIPIFGDQRMNIARAIEAGYGLQIDYNDMRVENIFETINEMLSNPKYTQVAEKISNRFNDRPMTPQQAAVYWTEYVIRHQGAPHLRSPGNDLSFIQFHMIDVYLILAVILALTTTGIYLTIKRFVKLFNQKSYEINIKKND